MDTPESQKATNREGAPKILQGPLNTDEESFPSLVRSGAPSSKPITSAWASPSGPRFRPAVVQTHQATESFTLTAIDLSTAGKDGKPTTLGEVMKQVMTKFKIKIEASTNQKLRQTTFHLKSDSQKELEKGKKVLLALLSPVVSLIVHAPVSTIAIIIGTKGANLKQIREQTNVRIDIPRRDALAPNGNGTANDSVPASGAVTPTPDDDDEEPTVPITVTGPQPFAQEAVELIQQRISFRVSRATKRVRDIPVYMVPMVKAQYSVYAAAAQSIDVELKLDSSKREVTVSGEREAVGRVIDAVRSTIDELAILQSIKLTLPKRQHMLLVGKAVDEIYASSNCTAVIPRPEESSEEVTVWGKPEDLPNGLSAVMNKANSKYIHEFPLPGPITLSKQLLSYMIYVDYPKSLMEAHPGVSVSVPNSAMKEKALVLNVDIIGDKPDVDATVRQVSELMGKLIGAIREVNIDWTVHWIVLNKYSEKIGQFHEVNNIILFFPPEEDKQSSVLMVYDPTTPSASPSPVEKAKNLDEVEKELLKFAREVADVKSQTVAVEKRWHDTVIGIDSTTLDAIIGEEKALLIKFGTEVGDGSTEDVIFVHGLSSEVDRAINEIQRIVEDAKNDLILSSYSIEFEIDRDYVGRVVGTQGAGVNRLRDQLSVKIDFSDEVDEGSLKEVGKKKKQAHQKSKVQIVGRKENVEEAKKRILSQVERLADETSEVLKIPKQYHSGLIGQNGKYVLRLEEKYGVKITFPRESAEGGESKTREPLKSDEVLIRGGRKGVANAKSEIMEAVEYEKESNVSITFSVPSRAVPRILGKSGATINDIKSETDAQIDLDRSAGDGNVQITCRGTKDAIAAAKTAILAIAEQVDEEKIVFLKVDHKFHRTLIGAGGQGLRDLISRCGGSSDTRAQAGLVRFPRQGEEPSDEVRLRGNPKIVEKLKNEIERVVEELSDRVVMAVDIPSAQHRALIGRGGRNLNEFQSKHNVQVQYPGSHSYDQAGEPANGDELSNVAPENLVKVAGPRKAIERAIEDLKSQVRAPDAEGPTETILVPLKYYGVVTQQGSIFRSLRNYGVQVEQGVQPSHFGLPVQPPPDASSARIDDEESEVQTQWEVVDNYQDAEEGDSEWMLKARDQAALDRAKNHITNAIERAKSMTRVGFLTLPDRSSFPRIVGSKGANIVRLHNETGADIVVGRENNTIVITGTDSSIEAAKEAILKTVSDSGRRGRN